MKNQAQINYYWRHRENILDKLAEKRRDPEYRYYKAQLALKSYYKRKGERNEPRNQEETKSTRQS